MTETATTSEDMVAPGLASAAPGLASAVRDALGGRHVVLVGLMGAGKTSVGRRLAARLGLPFIDSDHAIEESARMTIPEIFSQLGEAEFRAGEKKVIARLLGEPQQVIATGGGAYMDPETRARLRERGVTVWLRAELPVLMRRVQKRQNRPLLQTTDPEATMQALIDKRYPIYAEADCTVTSLEIPHDQMVLHVLEAMQGFLGVTPASPS
jgi:shikimate kinase